MLTLVRLHIERVMIVGLLLYISWDKIGYPFSVYQQRIDFRPFMEAGAIAIVALAVAVIVAFPIYKDWSKLNSKKS